jgi:hypothetical protein
MRLAPDGSRFYSIWRQEGEAGSDIWFRRVMDGDSPNNVAQ